MLKIQENILLAPYTTFKIGGEARYFAVIESVEDLREAVNFAKQNSQDIFILGGGSNLLISDDGFVGLVLKMEIKGISWGDEGSENGKVEIIAGAGEVMDDLIAQGTEKKLWGLENLSAIPGTVGASAVQNTGAFGVESQDLISWVEIFDLESGELKKLDNKDCAFSYRNSIFKKKKDWVVLKVAFSLTRERNLNLNYPKLGDFEIREDTSSLDVRKTIIEIRKKGSPLKDGLGSAGCFFKNPVISQIEFQKLQQKFPEMPFFAEGENIKIPVAWFLDKQFAWKGYSEGDVGVYNKHALMLVNKGNGKCEDIKKLADKMSKDLLEKTGLQLESEVVFLS